jgi:hypothetical protein
MGGRREESNSSSWVMIRRVAEEEEVSCPILGVMDRLARKQDLRREGLVEMWGRTWDLMCCLVSSQGRSAKREWGNEREQVSEGAREQH